MFFRQISDFEENFKFLDRLNVLLFNVWKDKNAEAYRTQSMEQLEMFYRNYVNEMRQKSEELSLLQKQIMEKLSELQQLDREMMDITNNPEIDGCWMCHASGYTDMDQECYSTREFVASEDELNCLEDIAEDRTGLFSVDSADTVFRL